MSVVAPTVRVHAAPALEPPYDDEIPAGVPVLRLAEPALPLDWSALLGSAGSPDAGVGGGLRTGGRVATPRPSTTTPRGSVASPARAAAARFVATFLDVLNGRRPPAHLRSLSGPTEAAALMEELTRAAALVAGPRGRPATAFRLRRLFVTEPRKTTIEAAAVVGDERRDRALAVRLDHRPPGWQCTAMRLL